MGTCVSKRDRSSQDLLQDIASLQTLLREQRAEADVAVKTLAARVEHLEKFSEDLIRLTEELKLGRAGGSATVEGTRLVVVEGVEYGLAFEKDGKVRGERERKERLVANCVMGWA